MKTLPSAIWELIVDWCGHRSGSRLAAACRAIRAASLARRLGCRRCPGWLQRYDYYTDGPRSDVGDSSDDSDLAPDINPGIDDGTFDDFYTLFCDRCSAIYSLCRGCMRPSICLAHSGTMSSDDGTVPSANDALAAGRGVDARSVVLWDLSSGPIMTRNIPRKTLIELAADSETELRATQFAATITTASDDIANTVLEQKFDVEDLKRTYAVKTEIIGDLVYTFDLTGSDGGVPIYWLCIYCDKRYTTSDK